MMKAPEKSKFDHGEFRDGYDDFAVNSAKYTIDEAVDIYAEEMDAEPGDTISVCTAFVRYHAGVDEDYEPVTGWWLEYYEHKTSCPVYAMHLKRKQELFPDRYKYYKVKEKEALGGEGDD